MPEDAFSCEDEGRPEQGVGRSSRPRKSELVWRTIFYPRKKPTRPLAATSTGFTIPSGAIQVSTSQARFGSKK
jgi:hypothetical protein